jgi:tripartite-type tricarboxylate transporter receptor subunit TctC
MKTSRWISALATTMAVAFNIASAAAQDYPTKPVRMILPYAAGGGTDVLARFYTAGLTQRLGQPVIVENRGGGGGLIGIRATLQSPADGYTMLFTTSIVALNPLMYKTAGYKFDDFVTVGPAGYYNYLLAVHNSVGAKNVKELVAYAKANPGKLNYASLGQGSPTTIITKRFLNAAGIDAVEIPYAGAGPSLKDLIAGTVQMSFFAAADPYLKIQNATSVGMADERRIPVATDLPTFIEQGLPTIVGGTWFGVFAPARTPAPIVAKARAALIATGLDIKDKLAATGTWLVPGGAEGFPEFIKRDMALWEADIKRLNIQINE